MAAKQSAGLLMFRRIGGAQAGDGSGHGDIEVLLAHPGGPFWHARDAGAWTIPKGGIHDGEDPLDTAIREFKEETGFDACGPFIPLAQVTQKSGKIVHAWAFEGTCDPATLVSMETTTEWPPRSGRHINIPEVDEVRFFDLPDARRAINVAQIELLERLLRTLRHRPNGT